jgi:FAD/FMN-containing dehydrogenase
MRVHGHVRRNGIVNVETQDWRKEHISVAVLKVRFVSTFLHFLSLGRKQYLSIIKMTAQQLDHLRSLLPESEVIERDGLGYSDQAAPWSVWADQRPPLVLQPTNLESMSKVVKYLYDSDLDFAVRNTGTGSVSAKDVILSTHGFKDFKFDKASQTVTLGSGYSWGEVDLLIEKDAPGYQLVGARCSWVGVTGSSLVGGLSWLSHEYGMISDPQNLLDMQIVLGDGKILWASEEPELMWALRGGGGNFGGK